MACKCGSSSLSEANSTAHASGSGDHDDSGIFSLYRPDYLMPNGRTTFGQAVKSIQSHCLVSVEKMSCEQVYFLARTIGEIMMAWSIPHPENQLAFLNWRAEKNTWMNRVKHLLTENEIVSDLYWGLTYCMKTKRNEELKKTDKGELVNLAAWKKQREKDREELEVKREELSKRGAPFSFSDWLPFPF